MVKVLKINSNVRGRNKLIQYLKYHEESFHSMVMNDHHCTGNLGKEIISTSLELNFGNSGGDKVFGLSHSWQYCTPCTICGDRDGISFILSLMDLHARPGLRCVVRVGKLLLFDVIEDLSIGRLHFS